MVVGEFEHYAHEQLVAMLAGGDPELLAARADELVAMADAFKGANADVFHRMAQVEWQGEGADAFRAWGRHLLDESAVLVDYAHTVGRAMGDAGEALRVAKSAMPPVPERPVPLVGGAVHSVGEELERQEAMRVLEQLSSSYRTVADDMAKAPEPSFRQLSGVDNPLEGNVPGGSAGSFGPGEAQPGLRESFTVAAPGGGFQTSEGHESSTVSRSGYPVDDGLGAGLIAPQGNAVDGRVGTSLDSITPVADRPLPVREPDFPPAVEGRGLAGSQGSELPGRAPATIPGQLPQRSGAPRPGVPGVPQPSGGSQTPQAARSLVPPSQDAYPAGRPSGAGTTGPGGQGPVGRPPMQGGAGAWGNGVPPRAQPPGAVIGGVRRPPASASRGLPPNTSIGTQTPFAYRDPATGLVSGPGGVPVMRHPGEAGNRPTPGEQRINSSRVGGRSPRWKRRRDGRDDVQDRNG
ncbi:hypothetical protein GCM10022245_48090 [Streptomyces mayteni]